MGLFSRKPKSEPVRAHSLPAGRQDELAQPSDVKKGSVKSVVLIQPLVTEKATATGTYLFRVAPLTTKSEIRKAFQAQYGKKPRKVNVVNVMGKVKMRGRVVGQRSNWKKAVVYLAKGETVDLFQ